MGLMVVALALGICLADDFTKQGFDIDCRFWPYASPPLAAIIDSSHVPARQIILPRIGRQIIVREVVRVR